MTRTVVVDAHVLLWFLEANPKLSEQVIAALSDPNARLLLPSIALAEACWVSRKGKTVVTIAELREAIEAEARLAVVPLDQELIFAAQELTGELEMHDSIIVATTAREVKRDPAAVLLTGDQQIRDSRLVPVIW